MGQTRPRWPNPTARGESTRLRQTYPPGASREPTFGTSVGGFSSSASGGFGSLMGGGSGGLASGGRLVSIPGG
jgi:hypothetical protein